MLGPSPPALAQGRVYGIARLGGDMGGEKVLQFTYEDGSTPDVPAGAGILLSGGGVFQLYKAGSHALEAQATAGIKYRTIPEATNQTADWMRFPVEAMAFYRAPARWRFGAGVTTHLRNVLKASGEVVNGRVAFSSSPGAIVQAEYVFRTVAIDARYTALRYKLEDDPSESVDASSFGLGFSYFFGRR